MKTLLFSKFTLLFGLLLACAFSAHFVPSPQHHSRVNAVSAVPHPMASPQPEQLPVNDPEQPQVIEVQQDESSEVTNVTVQVPPGTKQVTLQSREEANDWITRAVKPVAGSGRNLIFRVPTSVKGANLRVLGDANDSLLPASNAPNPLRSASDAQTKFARVSAIKPPAPAGTRNSGAPDAMASENQGSVTTARSVTESDIWKIRGRTLYFFNQLRGLQIIDITNADAPVRGGKLALPAVGEDMYIIDDTHVLLLARKGSRWDQSEIIAVTITDGTPAIAARFDVNGTINASRLVGTALYVATDSYETVTGDSFTAVNGGNDTAYVYGTRLASFDFSDPNSPVARNTLWFDGWNSSAVTATDRFFFIASVTDSTGSPIHVVDISSPNGTMVANGTIQAAGSVADKFKMGLNGDVFTVISQIWDWTGEETQSSSKLETFSLADPNTPVKLGELSIGAGEQLYATRIEAARAYVVTAEQIDPLWIIDFTDPTNPTVTGQVEVPGFSTFIQPLGDQLVTIGIVDKQVAISLFDVRDPAAPALLSRVAAGGTDSWSEAVWNEKAFSVLPEVGVILVPSSGWNSESGFAAQVQIIDLGATSLTLRGVINQPFEPRRATMFDNRILSISSHELLTVNAADRDHPAVTSDIALAWAVDRVFVQGNYLIEVEDGSSWNSSTPTLRVALASDPDQVQSKTNLAAAPVLGATTRGSQLYLAQSDVQTSESGETTSTLIVSSYDLTQLPQLLLLGETQTNGDALDAGASLDALWPHPDVLVWADSGNSRGLIFWGQPVIMDAGSVSGGNPTLSRAANLNLGSALNTSGTISGRGGSTTGNRGATSLGLLPATDSGQLGAPNSWWWGGSGQGRLFAFDVAGAGAPTFLSETTFATDAWSAGAAFAGDGAIYASHAGALEINETGSQGWAEGWFLDVIDFTDPAAPVLRDPVSIPTLLIGVNNATTQNATLFTLGSHVQDENNSTQSLDASAYDGVSVTLLDTVELTGWSNPAVVDNAAIFIGKSTDDSLGAIDTWALSGDNHLALLGSTPVNGTPWNLRAFGALLALQIDGQVLLFDKSDPVSLRQIGASEGDSCFFGLNLDSAAGELMRGLWVPLGDYGVLPIGVSEEAQTMIGPEF